MMKKIKALLKSKVGMTFVELLTALALLVIIITSFTPMLLNSYETLYKAGEISETTYISKTEVEKSLASRASDTIENFQLKFESLGKEIFIKMRAALTDLQENDWLQEGIQTFYYGGNGYIKVVSPSTVPDNEPWKEVVIQFKGIVVNDVTPGGADAAKIITQTGKEDEYVIGVEVVLPNTKDGSAVSEGELFNPTIEGLSLKTGQYDVTMDPNNKRQAIIRIYESVDVVTSIIQINAHYLDENKNKNVATAYVKIIPANIMLVGETSTANQVVAIKDADGNVVHNAEIPNVAYYTSPGVVPVKDDAGKVTGLDFSIYPRTLSTKNTPNLVSYSDNEGLPYPKGTVFSTIKWVDNDDSPYLSAYYVMAGNNGVIQRLFVSNGSATDTSAIVGKDLTGAPYKDGGLTKMLYPTFWGGDRSHQFGYASSHKGPGYDNSRNDKTSAWYTASTASGSAHYNMYAAQTRYSYYFNGQGVQDDYEIKNGRRISYTLTEYGFATRAIGALAESDDFRDDLDSTLSYYMAWEHPHTRPKSGDAFRNKKWHVYGTLGFDSHNDWQPYHEPVGYYSGSSTDTDDSHISYIRLKQLNTHGFVVKAGKDYTFGINNTSKNYDESFRTSRHICFSGCGCVDTNGGSISDSRQDVTTKVNITDFYYDEATGKMTYIGTVNAFASLAQTDNISDISGFLHSYEKAHHLKSDDTDSSGKSTSGGTTGYFIESDTDGSGVTLYKISTEISGDYDANVKVMFQTFKGLPVGDNPLSLGSWANQVTTISDPVQFFATRTYTDANSGNWKTASSNKFYKLTLSDVNFTMGYSSNREKMYSNITWDGANEQYRSYEPYYFWSHYGNQHMYPGTSVEENLHTYNLNSYTVENTWGCRDSSMPTKLTSPGDQGYWYTNKRWVNSINNDYYNVWFPGEMYNLTKTATKDGVTVAVGYAVSGSTFQWNHLEGDTSNRGNTSTALGSVYNDGVLAATTGNASSTEPMKNLLYYKDATAFDYDSLTSKYNTRFQPVADQTTTSKDANGLGADGYGKYGTHSRLSVQFTAVDLAVRAAGSDGSTATREYWAVFGDNHGRVFFAMVGRTNARYTTDANGNVTSVPDGSSTKLVDGIRDLSPANESETITNGDWSGMGELTVNGQSFSNTFSYINNIYIFDTEIFIVGKSKSGNSVVILGGKFQLNANGEIVDFPAQWKTIDMTSALGSGSYTVHDMMLLNGYIYAAGEKAGGGGFCVAVNKLYFDAFFSTNLNEANNAAKDYPMIARHVPYKVYSIAGNSQ